MKLFVDDLRECPKGWLLARTITEAIRYLHQFNFEVVSLDHDIVDPNTKRRDGFSVETFEPVAYHLSLMNPRPKVLIHTSNFTAGQRMAEILGIGYNPVIYNPSDYERSEYGG